MRMNKQLKELETRMKVFEQAQASEGVTLENFKS